MPSLFAVCAPGLESILQGELRELGVRSGAAEPGGVAFEGEIEAICRANLWLRTASRVIVRVGEFHVRALGELERRARKLPWEQYVGAGRSVRLRVTCRKSRLYHTDAVAERIAGAIGAHMGGAGDVALAKGEEESLPADAQLVVARVLHDRCVLSVDSSGQLLHMRGYRQATAKAPLRETLAAALLLASGWDMRAPLLDPMCGAGTIPIEGALLARRIAPGLNRRFAFMDWPDFDPALWRRLLDEARSRVISGTRSPIQGSDRDAGAIEAAMANAERAGVAADVELTRRALSAIEPPAKKGWLVTNPPYGVRVGERERLRDLYAQLGNVARQRCEGWTMTLLSAEPRLEAQIGVPLEQVARTRNGGLAVRMMRGAVP